MADLAHIEGVFPLLVGTSYSEESEETDTYNCIAFAFGDTSNWWWPRKAYGYYWPPGFPFDDSVGVLIQIVQLHGYEKCSTPDHKAGCEKVAIYSDGGRFKHAARQLQSGRWASKLGDEQDIKHEAAGHLDGSAYGVATHFMSRKRTDWI